jgi:hypothetical protein
VLPVVRTSAWPVGASELGVIRVSLRKTEILRCCGAEKKKENRAIVRNFLRFLAFTANVTTPPPHRQRAARRGTAHTKMPAGGRAFGRVVTHRCVRRHLDLAAPDGFEPPQA